MRARILHQPDIHPCHTFTVIFDPASQEAVRFVLFPPYYPILVPAQLLFGAIERRPAQLLFPDGSELLVAVKKSWAETLPETSVHIVAVKSHGMKTLSQTMEIRFQDLMNGYVCF
jgi:hypothetical protein